MKHIYTYGVSIMFILVAGGLYAAWNPFKKSSWKGVVKAANVVAKETKKAANVVAKETTKAANVVAAETTKAANVVAAQTTKAVQATSKGFRDFGELFEKEVINPTVAAGDATLAKLKDCAEVVALGSEWAAKKSAYETANASLIAAREMVAADPRVFGQYAGHLAATVGLEAGKLSAEGVSKMMEGMGVIIGGGFNITEATFDAQATDLEKGKLPLFVMKGVFFGKAHQLTFQFDVNRPVDSMEAVVKELIKLVPGV